MIRDIREKLELFVQGKGKGLAPFPKSEPSRFKGIMNEMMGFDEDHL
jgi:hypothetical protein